MENFIPYSKEKADKLRENMSKTMFQSPEYFIEVYNSGIINKSHETTTEIVEKIKSTYKDIEEIRNQLVFLTPAEVIHAECEKSISLWGTVLPLQRELKNLIERGDLGADETFVLMLGTQNGYVFKFGEDGKPARIGKDRVVTRMSLIPELHSKLSSVKNLSDKENDLYAFSPNDILSLDSSFIFKVREVIEDL